MKKITKLMLTLALLVIGVEGAKMNAGKVYGTCSYANDCTWNAETNTMSFTGVNGWQILLTGLPGGDITGFTTFHVTLSSMSDNIDNIRLCVKDKSGNQAWHDLVPGENNVDLAALAEAYPDRDFTNIDDITLWSPSSAAAGKTVDGEHPASVVITNVYLQCVKNISNAVLNDEITDMSYLTAGNRFVIANTSSTQIQAYPSNDPAAVSPILSSVKSDMYYYFTIEALPALDVDNDGVDDEATYYRIAIQNEAGTAKPTSYWHGNYVNRIGWGSLWSTSCQADGKDLDEAAYGRDGDYNAVWTITYEEGNGFVIYNPKNNMYMTLDGTTSGKSYFKLYQSLDLVVNSEFDKEDNAANDAIFSFTNATGYDDEAGTITNGGWTFTDPVDISNWDYLVITTVDNASNNSVKVKITDVNNASVEGNQYSGSTAGTGNDMYLDQWNHQNAIKISVDYLRVSKDIDISKIKSLTFANNNGGGDCVISISNVYLTDYNNTNLSGGYVNGDVKRDYSETGKFGTICLSYKASYAGAEIYSIIGGNSTSISLEKVTGLLEAGKPYFYMSADERGRDNAGSVRNVNFFRADLAKFDAASEGTNNGLIGTFKSIYAPVGENYYILSNNTLYDTVGATGDDAITVGANRAYIDVEQITNSSSAKGRVNLFFDGAGESTGIENLNAIETLTSGKVYDLSGRVVTAPTKGLYIVNGKKVFVK